MQRCAMFLVMLLAVIPAWGFERISIARLTDENGVVTYEIMSPDEIRARDQALGEKRLLYQHALRLTMQAWHEDADTARTPFPRSAVAVPAIENVSTFMNEGDAQRRLAQLREQQSRQARPQEGPAVARVRAMYRRQLSQAQMQLARQRRQHQRDRTIEEGALPLEDIEPLAVEFGMVEDSPEVWDLLKGPGVLDQRMYGRGGAHWPNAMKVVSEVAADAALPEGESYSSFMTEHFAVGGEFITGVGIWLPAICSYHWIEYPIPEGATGFKADVYITDDVHGVGFHREMPQNNAFGMDVKVDGAVVANVPFLRFNVLSGSGERIGEISLSLPSGAERLRFYASSMAIDNNWNSEIVIHNGRFLF